jgi:uncharacterized membrane protein YkvA (DUF1232 family)
MNLWKQLWRMIQMTRRVGGWQAALAVARTAPKQLQLFRRLLLDYRVPVLAKVVLTGALVFAVSPLNFPQYIPIVGALDDIGIVLFAANFFLKQVPMEVLAEHRHSVGLGSIFETA